MQVSRSQNLMVAMKMWQLLLMTLFCTVLRATGNVSVYTTASSPLYNGSQALVSCHVELDPTLVDPETSVIVTWKFGTFEVFGDNLLTVSPLVGDGRTYQRNLTFQVLLISDTGSWLCEATVVTLGGNRSTNTSRIYLSVEVPPSAQFQLRLPDIGGCRDWLLQFSAETQDAIDAIADNTEQLCQCGFTRDHIMDPVFQCFGVEADEVTFRAQLFATTRANTSQIIAYMNHWINGGSAVVNIDNILYTPDPNCVVAIQSVNDPECEGRSVSLRSAVATSLYGLLAVVLIVFFANGI